MAQEEIQLREKSSESGEFASCNSLNFLYVLLFPRSSRHFGERSLGTTLDLHNYSISTRTDCSHSMQYQTKPRTGSLFDGWSSLSVMSGRVTAIRRPAAQFGNITMTTVSLGRFESGMFTHWPCRPVPAGADLIWNGRNPCAQDANLEIKIKQTTKTL